MLVKVDIMEINSDEEHNIGDDSHHEDIDDDNYYSGASESESDDEPEPIVATRGKVIFGL